MCESAVKALRLLEAGDWNGAHAVVQDDPSREAAWVHAHLHRVEGDLDNAAYWYGKAGRPFPTDQSSRERQAMLAALTARLS